MRVDPANIPTRSLEVDLDENQGLNSLLRCIKASGASSAQFARLMGASPSAMSLWLRGKRPLSPMAIRACYWAAAMSGVPVRLPNPQQYLAATAKASKEQLLN